LDGVQIELAFALDGISTLSSAAKGLINGHRVGSCDGNAHYCNYKNRN